MATLKIDKKNNGYVVITSIPAVTMPYDDLESIALELGLHDDYLPVRTKAKHSESAWRKAMSLGARGVDSAKLSRFARKGDIRKVDSDERYLWKDYKVDSKDSDGNYVELTVVGAGKAAIAKHGLKPYQVEIRYIVKDVSGKVPTKHVIRETYVKTDKLAENIRSDRAKGKFAETQLESVTVMILEYVTTSSGKTGAKYTATPAFQKFDESIRDNVLKPAYDRHKSSADSQRIRVKLTEALKDNSAVPARSGGGVMILPSHLSDKEITQLNAIREFFVRMADYMDKPVLKSGNDATKPSLQLIPIGQDSGDMFDYAEAVNHQLTEEATEIFKWTNQIDKDSTKLGHAKNFNAKAKDLHRKLDEKLRKFQQSMGKQIALAGDMQERLDMALAESRKAFKAVETRTKAEELAKAKDD